MKTETRQVKVTTFCQGELGAIQIKFECRDENDEGCGNQGVRNNVFVDPYFLVDAGLPVCPECGEDMGLAGAKVTTEGVSLF